MSFFLSIFDLVVSTGLTLTRGEPSFGVTSWSKNTHHCRIFLCFTVSEGGRGLSLPSCPNFESSKRKVRNLQLLLDSFRTSLTQETSVSPHRSTNSQHTNSQYCPSLKSLKADCLSVSNFALIYPKKYRMTFRRQCRAGVKNADPAVILKGFESYFGHLIVAGP